MIYYKCDSDRSGLKVILDTLVAHFVAAVTSIMNYLQLAKDNPLWSIVQEHIMDKRREDLSLMEDIKVTEDGNLLLPEDYFSYAEPSDEDSLFSEGSEAELTEEDTTDDEDQLIEILAKRIKK